MCAFANFSSLLHQMNEMDTMKSVHCWLLLTSNAMTYNEKTESILISQKHCLYFSRVCLTQFACHAENFLVF